MTLANLPPLVTVIGGSGFVGRYVVGALAKRGYRIRVVCRRPDLALFLQPLGNVGQISFVQANLRYPDSVRTAVEGSDHVINCVGLLAESGKNTFKSVQEQGAAVVAAAVNSIASSDWSKVRPRRVSLAVNTAPPSVVTAMPKARSLW